MEYNTDRFNETWRERNGWSDKALRDREKTRKTKRRNREPGRFGKVNWDAYQHDQLFDMIMKADLGEMSGRALQWQKLAQKIESTTAEVQRVMERVMGAWHGQAAVASATSNTRLMTWAGTASQTAGKIAEGMSTYTDAVDRAQRHMPDPAFATAERNFRNGYTVTGTGGPSTAVLLQQLLSDGVVSHEQARARKAEAVAVMEAYESQSKDVHDGMPHFTDAAPTTTDDVPERTPPPDPGPYSTPSPTPGQRPPVADQPGPSGSVPGDSATSAQSYVTPPAPGTSTGPGVPGGTGYGGGLGSLGSGGSDVIRNSPGFGAGGGLGGPGGLAGAAPVGAAGRGAGALGGARGAGMPGAFGGMPVGAAQGDEDKEHKNKYDQGMDFLDDLPPAYPSVFGA